MTKGIGKIAMIILLFEFVMQTHGDGKFMKNKQNRSSLQASTQGVEPERLPSPPHMSPMEGSLANSHEAMENVTASAEDKDNDRRSEVLEKGGADAEHARHLSNMDRLGHGNSQDHVVEKLCLILSDDGTCHSFM